MVSFLSLCGPATRAENAQILSDAKREGETRCKIRGRICHKDSAFLREMSCDSKKTKAIHTSDCPAKKQCEVSGYSRRSPNIEILFQVLCLPFSMAQEMAERILFALHIQRLFRLIGKKRLHSLLCNDCLLRWDRVIG